MSQYVFRKHGKGYLAIVYGVHVGQVERVTYRVESWKLAIDRADYHHVIKTGWQPSNENAILPIAPTRQAAARALWDAHQALIRNRGI